MCYTGAMGYEQELIEASQCPELVWVHFEDGPMTGRCLGPIVAVEVPPDPRYGDTEPEVVAVMCEGHSQEWLGWRAMSEWDRAAWERAHDEG